MSIAGLECTCALNEDSDRIAYILYPMDILDDWIEPAAARYGVNIAVITGMDWQNVFSPWKSKGVPKGTPDFKGDAPEFLQLMNERVVPAIERELMPDRPAERTLFGVSMSGLFALWQWMICDTFTNIASLSGSFWYEGFTDWMGSQAIPQKTGTAYFLLGNQESHTSVKAFSTVAVDTQEIVCLLQSAGIHTIFQPVPGNHYSDPLPRIEAAFTAIYK